MDWLKTRWYALSAKSAAFKRVFDGKDGEVVLADLAKFCHLERSTLKISPLTGMADPLAMAHAEGRRETLLRIMAYVGLTQQDVAKMRASEEAGQQNEEF